MTQLSIHALRRAGAQALLLLLFLLAWSRPAVAQDACVPVLDPCAGGQVCDALGECRNQPSLSGQLCGAGVPCASGLTCSSLVAGRCVAQGQSGDSCAGIGQSTCASGLVCDARGECRSDPPQSGEPCGGIVSCAGNLVCSDLVAGRCETRHLAGQSCFGLGQGNCASGLVCDALGECRNEPPQFGEFCGAGVPCADGLACSALVAGRCQAPRALGQSCVGFDQGNCASNLSCDAFSATCVAQGGSGSACTGVGQGTCAAGLLCDARGECRGDPPQLNEFCGIGVPCAGDLVCTDGIGRCESRGVPGDSCTGLGQGSCTTGLVCDALGECRSDPPQFGELCGTGVPCAGDLLCDAAVGGRCGAPGTSRAACTGIGQGTCAAGLVCDALGECRSEVPVNGELCGIGVECVDGLVCSNNIISRCQTADQFGESCSGFFTDSTCDTGLTCNPNFGFICVAAGQSTDRCSGVGQSTCDAGLVCDIGRGECRAPTPVAGEVCGFSVPCAEGLACGPGARCAAAGSATEACTGIGQGSCADGLVCDVSGECRSSPPRRGELCGIGVPCAAGLACNDLVAGRCDVPVSVGQICTGLGQGNCQPGLLCDVSGICRNNPPRFGEPCGRTDACAEGLACNAEIGGTCGFPVGIGETCAGLGRGNCIAGAVCQLAPAIDGSRFGFQARCTPERTAQEMTVDVCRQFYGSGGQIGVGAVGNAVGLFNGEQVKTPVALAAEALGTPINFGAIGQLAGGLSGTAEIGTLYGPDGEFACYLTTCAGALSNAEVGVSSCVGVYNTYSVFAGRSTATVQGVSPIPGEVVEFSTSQVFTDSLPVTLIGSSNCLGLSLGALPVEVGIYSCSTDVVEVMTQADTDGDGVPNAQDLCPRSAILLPVDADGCNGLQAGTDGNGDGLPDDVSTVLGLDPELTDSDGDGTPDIEEIGADPSRPKDSDFDGVIDALEDGDAALDGSLVSNVLLRNRARLTLRTLPGQSLFNLRVFDALGGPAGVSFPYGVIAYQATSESAGSVNIQLDFSAELPATGLVLYKVSASGVFTELGPNVWTQTSPARIELILTDGDAITDLDGEINGLITDPLAIGIAGAISSSSAGGGTSSSSSGGGGSGGGGGGSGRFDWPLLLLAGAAFAARRRLARVQTRHR